ncbi:hypothetical protein J8N05_35080 [Streptomyces sp. BH-SS-21]|uniref:SMODS and SLOG-associating 2TM effector domain-containing protein n=1 Tax=Streptomyces liliiviolaceus TaxID=2823109 RepID=A0A941BB58_9ACTN|nr:hypothetical protein [Streptomyces liliiviolaceus]MBQ0853392.1 hypothetical protein [Streptomyces liliiviolaceus]
MNRRQGDGAARRVGDSRAARWNLSDGEELERALRSAEHLLAQAEERKRHENNRTFATLSVIAGTVFSLAASLVAVAELITFSNTGSRVFATITPVVVSVSVIVTSVISLLRDRRELEDEYPMRLATQIASMVAETMLDVAEREDWSYFRLEVTKLRLSAFPLIDRPRNFGGR